MEGTWTWRGHTYGRDIEMKGHRRERDIDVKGTHTWKGHTHGEDIHKE